MNKSLIPQALLELDDDQKRAFAAAYWMGVCVGELLNLGMSEEDVRAGFECALARGLAMRKAGTS
jgi:hypothetical protein